MPGQKNALQNSPFLVIGRQLRVKSLPTLPMLWVSILVAVLSFMEWTRTRWIGWEESIIAQMLLTLTITSPWHQQNVILPTSLTRVCQANDSQWFLMTQANKTYLISPAWAFLLTIPKNQRKRTSSPTYRALFKMPPSVMPPPLQGWLLCLHRTTLELPKMSGGTWTYMRT